MNLGMSLPGRSDSVQMYFKIPIEKTGKMLYIIHKTEKEVKTMGKFIIKNTNTGIKFDLKAANGEVIATSEVYNSEASCRNGIDSVMRNAPVAPVENQTVEGFEVQKHPKFEVYTDKAGEFRFRLKARNGEIIAVSEGYKALASCMNGIESVKKNAVDAPIEKVE